MKAWHVYYQPDIGGAKPFYLCEVRRRTEEEARTLVGGYYEGKSLTYGDRQLPATLDRMRFAKLCRVITEDDKPTPPPTADAVALARGIITELGGRYIDDDQEEKAGDPRPMPHWQEHDDQAEPDEIHIIAKEQGPDLSHRGKGFAPQQEEKPESMTQRDYDQALANGWKPHEIAGWDTMLAEHRTKAEEPKSNALEVLDYRSKRGKKTVQPEPKPKTPPPYAWEFTATFGDLKEHSIARVASNVNTAQKAAMRGKGVTSLRDPRPLTERQYSDTYGSRRIKAH